ncbi:carbohydrate ABC transporter permease [Paenibacillus sp.]|uniref:carbohydrate ABC transporter permease n=1 Tax=Paenibacillus sp. TaxID=58172 RepID=UPI002811D905|nr:carbohydrate ABC transporter permease [Paenibacillus sp.]
MRDASLRESSVGAAGKHALLIGLSFLAIFPFYWALNTSFKSPGEIYSPSLFPADWTFDNYVQAWQAIPMARMLSNSLTVAVGQTVTQLLTSVLAAYAFTRWEFRGRHALYALISLTWLVPFQVIMIPNYVVISDWGLRNSLLGLIIPNVASAFAVLQLYQTFRSFPKALVEAAQLDGASSWGILWRVIFPNLRAAIASIGVLLFISSWNDYFWPLLVTNKPEYSTLQIGLQSFMSTEANQWGPLMAATTIASLPILLIYLLLQRQIIDSFVKGGLR